ncbi:17837_t:CDS:2, partial [Gigaspora margarita]
ITTDLWFLHNDKLYIGVIARWIDPKDWLLKEALLVCEKINEKHTTPFYEPTKMLSEVSYAILNMVCCTIYHLKKTVALPNDQDEDYYAELLYGELDITASQNLWFKKYQAIELPVTITNILEQIKFTIYLTQVVTETQYNMANRIITYNNPPKLLLTNEQPNVNQVNYSLIGLSDNSDKEESNMLNEVICYLALPKEAQRCNL